MLQEKEESSLSNEAKKVKKKKYLYLDNFNAYVKQHEIHMSNRLDEIWHNITWIAVISGFSLLGVIYLLIKN